MKILVKNSSLVFQKKHQKTIVYKNYWLRQDGQYIDLSDYSGVASLKFNQTKFEADFYIGKTLFSRVQNFISSRSGNNSFTLGNKSGVGYFTAGNDAYTNSSVSYAVTVGVHSVVFNNYTGVAIYDNGEPQSFTTPGSSDLQVLWMFVSGNASSPLVDDYDEGAVKIARIKVYNATNDTLLLDIRPAIVDNVPCLYEAVNDIELYSEDETVMVLE